MISVVGVGDIMPGGVLSGMNIGWASDEVLTVLQDADIRVGTLECAIGNEPIFYDEKMKRQGDVIYARDSDLTKLKVLGIDIVSLANNHFFDLGLEGAVHTIQLLDGMGVSHIGAGMNLDQAKRPVVKEIDGKTVAFTAFCDWRDETVGWCPIATETNPGVNPMYDDYVENEISNLKQQYDFVVVMPHWGKEHTWVTTNHVHAMAQKMVKAGADIVLGSHPHRVQPVVRYNESVVAYSLGNFLFPDRLICKPRSTYYDDKITDYSKLPRTDGYPYVEEVTYKAWKPLSNIGMIVKVNLNNMSITNNLTLMGGRELCLVSQKETEHILAYRGLLLKYVPYELYYKFYNLIHQVPHLAKSVLLRCLFILAKTFKKKRE